LLQSESPSGRIAVHAAGRSGLTRPSGPAICAERRARRDPISGQYAGRISGRGESPHHWWIASRMHCTLIRRTVLTQTGSCPKTLVPSKSDLAPLTFVDVLIAALQMHRRHRPMFQHPSSGEADPAGPSGESSTRANLPLAAQGGA